MSSEQVDFSAQELKLLQEAQAQLGLSSIEQTIEYLLQQRLKERLLAIAGREIIKQQHRR